MRYNKGNFFYSITVVRCLRHRHTDQHVFKEDTVAAGGVGDQHVRHGAHDFPILEDRGTRHECVQVGTTLFNEKFTKSAESNQMITLGGNYYFFG